MKILIEVNKDSVVSKLDIKFCSASNKHAEPICLACDYKEVVIDGRFYCDCPYAEDYMYELFRNKNTRLENYAQAAVEIHNITSKFLVK